MDDSEAITEALRGRQWSQKFSQVSKCVGLSSIPSRQSVFIEWQLKRCVAFSSRMGQTVESLKRSLQKTLVYEMLESGNRVVYRYRLRYRGDYNPAPL
ncbi:hypothetical protein J6590_035053 [Homalodisca vitripennis]|nr:hypothetical protein J6590_035053 [Homalodisca vitripennis]